jgi:hypothetical protein
MRFSGFCLTQLYFHSCVLLYSNDPLHVSFNYASWQVTPANVEIIVFESKAGKQKETGKEKEEHKKKIVNKGKERHRFIRSIN